MKFLSRLFRLGQSEESKTEEVLPVPNIRMGMWCIDLESDEVCIPVDVTDHGNIVIHYADKQDGTYVRTTAVPIWQLRQAYHEEIPIARRPEIPMTNLGY